MRSILAVSLLAVSLGACGGDDDKKDRGQIVFAHTTFKTGVFAAYYPIAAGSAALAVKTINDAGGILNSDVVIEEHDEASGTNGVQPVTDVAKHTRQEGVQVWIGPYVSDSGLAMGPIAGDNQRLLISPLVGASAFSTIDDHDYAFRGLESPEISAVAGAVQSYNEGARTAAPCCTWISTRATSFRRSSATTLQPRAAPF